jgi:cytochrome c-type biogenesis protein
MDFNMTLGGVLLAGILSFASPCVLPLVPPYLCYVAGTSLDALTAGEGDRAATRRTVIAAAAFVLGFSTVFVTLGLTASLIGRLLAQYQATLSIVAGAVIIVMGLHFLGVFRIALINREARVHVQHKPPGLIGAYVLGLAFAFGWTPCIGPVLGAVLAVAASADGVATGGLLLAVYALGLGVPFLIAAAASGPFIRFMHRFKRHLATVERTMGALLVVTGVLFLTGQMATMSFWLLETFPALGRIG